MNLETIIFILSVLEIQASYIVLSFLLYLLYLAIEYLEHTIRFETRFFFITTIIFIIWISFEQSYYKQIVKDLNLNQPITRSQISEIRLSDKTLIQNYLKDVNNGKTKEHTSN